MIDGCATKSPSHSTLEQPTDAQKKLIGVGKMYVYLMDLPGSAWPNYNENELMPLAMAEFGPPPEGH
jgi:hypothetical protein